jgi:hypothetical protein
MRIFISQRAKRKAEIKLKAQQIIYSRYPQWLQANILADGDTEEIRVTWGWINSIRDHSNLLESQVDAGIAIDLESGWPS